MDAGTSVPRRVYFNVRTRDDSDLQNVGNRIEKILGVTLSPYTGTRYDIPVLETTVLGIWIVLAPVQSVQADAPKRYQLKGRQRPSDDTEFSEEFHDIDDYILHILNDHEPGRWYYPSETEARIDLGLEQGRVQDLDR